MSFRNAFQVWQNLTHFAVDRQIHRLFVPIAAAGPSAATPNILQAYQTGPDVVLRNGFLQESPVKLSLQDNVLAQPGDGL